MSTQPNSNRDFVANILPWVVAAGVMILYLVTLNTWVNFNSLWLTAQTAGWDWRPSYLAPLHYVLTLPIRLLPESGQPLALNLFAAICAVLTLALLARSVALLPQDRTRDQRSRERNADGRLSIPLAWVPPVLAAGVLGLQLTFWENAVAGTGEMLNLLIFAYVIRCLLEFRTAKKESWLAKMALVYGLGITNNWAMIGFFPLFLVALIWIRGKSFFQFDFIARMLFFGVLGLSLYLVLPLVEVIAGAGHATFLEALRENLRHQKMYLWDATPLRNRVLWVSLTSVLPILIIGFRWPSTFRETNPIGSLITNLMFRAVHVAFLAIGLWIFFDPLFSGRELGFGLAFLPFYYLTALAVGYFSGYALLVFGKARGKSWERPSPAVLLINKAVVAAVLVALIAVPVLLLANNFPLIRAQGMLARQYADTMVQLLPEKGAVVISDDINRLLLLKAAYARAGRSGDHLLLDSASLAFPAYHEYLHKRYPDFVPLLPSLERLPDRLEDLHMLQIVDRLAQEREVYYSHPSFGYYFERFYRKPQGLISRLAVHEAGQIRVPPLSEEELEQNLAFWRDFEQQIPPQLPQWAEKISDAQILQSYYAMMLNDWGVYLQRNDRIEEAQHQFALARTLNPDNLAARLNQDFNKLLQAGQVRPIQPDEESLKRIRSWQAAMQQFGAFDEPNACFQLGQAFARGNNLRQAAEHFLRILDFMPGNLDAQIALVKTYYDMGGADRSLELISEIRSNRTGQPLLPTYEYDLVRTEALSYLAKSEAERAEQVILADLERYPRDVERLAFLAQFHLITGRADEAMATIEKQLALAPANPGALMSKAVLKMRNEEFEEAIPALDRFLELHPDNFAALMNRAISHLQIGRLEAAQRDYEELEKLVPQPLYSVHYGLGEIAYRQNNRSAAIKHYRAYLRHAPKETDEYRQIEERYGELRGGRRG